MPDTKRTLNETCECGLQETLELLLVLNKLQETGHILEQKRVIDVFYETNTEGVKEKKPVASIFPDDKYIMFHDEFTQIGIEVPGLGKLVSDLDWTTNHT